MVCVVLDISLIFTYDKVIILENASLYFNKVSFYKHVRLFIIIRDENIVFLRFGRIGFIVSCLVKKNIPLYKGHELILSFYHNLGLSISLIHKKCHTCKRRNHRN